MKTSDINDKTYAQIMDLAVKIDGKPVVRGKPIGSGIVARKKTAMPIKLVETGFKQLFDGVEFTLPIKLEPTTNNGIFKKWLMRVATVHRRAWFKALAPRMAECLFLYHHLDQGGTVHVSFNRLGRPMDTDNLQPTAKWLRDSIALGFGRGDGLKDPFVWYYDQTSRAFSGVVVTLKRNP